MLSSHKFSIIPCHKLETWSESTIRAINCGNNPLIAVRLPGPDAANEMRQTLNIIRDLYHLDSSDVNRLTLL